MADHLDEPRMQVTPAWSGSDRLAAVLAALLLFLLTVAFWKYRIFDSGVSPAIDIVSVDLYISHVPTVQYGFEALESGRIPLWNPYQFCGEPFMAVSYTALFYPPHLVGFLVDVPTSVEILFVLHMFFGGLSMWWLARHVGIGRLGGLAAALTFMWSGWIISQNTLPMLFEAMCWVPFTVLMIDRVLLGARQAWMWLIAALACQFLLGAMEVTLHTMYAGGLFAVCRLVQLAGKGVWIPALRRSALLLVCIAAAALLASPQLLPTIELTRLSSRAAGSLTWEQASLMGRIPPYSFLEQAVQNFGFGSVGVLPLIGFGLVLGFKRQRMVLTFGLVAAVGAAFLVFGGAVYRLYYEIPIVGGLFRRPFKFLDIYGFAQALLAGVAIDRLCEWGGSDRREVLRHWSWLLALAIGCAGTLWLASVGRTNWYWPAMVGLLLLFGIVSGRSLRIACVVGMVALHGANVFWTTGNTYQRPLQQPHLYDTRREVFDLIKSSLGDSRVYLSPALWFNPGLTAKQGMLRKIPVSVDYEPLAVGRYQQFFETVSMEGVPDRLSPAYHPFAGAYDLGPGSRWRLMDLTGTKFFVMQVDEPGDRFMIGNPNDFRVVLQRRKTRVFARTNVLPRASFVRRARVLEREDEVLAALDSPTFDPRTEVLLEEPVEGITADATASGAPGEVTIDSYEPEQVVITARVDTPGFLVFGDLLYPGWKAFIGDREVPIHRANYLFRAVRLDPGTSKVRFEYRPASFRLGLVLSAATALMLIGACWGQRHSGASAS